MLIRNYGLFWHRNDVHWGRQKNSGTLMGRLSGKARSELVDFRLQRGVYVLYDDNFKIIYVGQAGGKNDARLFVRLRAHRKDHLALRWSRFSWFGVDPVKDSKLLAPNKDGTLTPQDALNHIEAILLAAAEPPLNLQRGRFGKSVEHYIQPSLDLQAKAKNAQIPQEDDEEFEDGEDTAIESEEPE